MGMVSQNTDLIFGAVSYFLEDKHRVKFAYREKSGIAFETESGDLGSVVRSKENKYWEIKVQDETLYKIEPQVFSIISTAESAPNLDEYIKMLQKVRRSKMKKRSLGFVNGLLNTIGGFCLSGYAKNQEPVTVGPFFVYYRNTGEKVSIILN
jgi:hypothetical protein